MKYNPCNTHPHQKEEYFCTNLHCLTNKEAKLQCIECFQSHVFQKVNKLHESKHFVYFIKKSLENQQKYKEIQENNAELLNKYLTSLDEIIDSMKQNFISNLEILQKQVTAILESENQINSSNIEASSKLLQNADESQYLQNAIYFYKLDTEKLKYDIDENRKNLQRIINFHVDQLGYKSQEFCDKKFNTEFYQASPNFTSEIITVQSYDVQIGACPIHKIECNYICIDELCQPLKSSQGQCTNCLDIEHKSQQKFHDSKQFYDLREEQQQKIQKIIQEKRKTKEILQVLMKDMFEKIKEQQQKVNNQFEQMRLRVKTGYEKVLKDYIDKEETSDYLIGDIDKNLLKITLEDIELKASSQAKFFSDEMQFIYLDKETEYYKVQVENHNIQEKFKEDFEKLKQKCASLEKQLQEAKAKLNEDYSKSTIQQILQHTKLLPKLFQESQQKSKDVESDCIKSEILDLLQQQRVLIQQGFPSDFNKQSEQISIIQDTQTVDHKQLEQILDMLSEILSKINQIPKISQSQFIPSRSPFSDPSPGQK